MSDEITRKTDSGTILDSLNVRNIPRLRLVLPPAPIRARFEAIGRPLRALMEHKLADEHSLACLRDTLLPKLLSGEIRIRDAERIIEAHV